MVHGLPGWEPKSLELMISTYANSLRNQTTFGEVGMNSRLETLSFPITAQFPRKGRSPLRNSLGVFWKVSKSPQSGIKVSYVMMEGQSMFQMSKQLVGSTALVQFLVGVMLTLSNCPQLVGLQLFLSLNLIGKYAWLVVCRQDG